MSDITGNTSYPQVIVGLKVFDFNFLSPPYRTKITAKTDWSDDGATNRNSVVTQL